MAEKVSRKRGSGARRLLHLRLNGVRVTEFRGWYNSNFTISKTQTNPGGREFSARKQSKRFPFRTWRNSFSSLLREWVSRTVNSALISFFSFRLKKRLNSFFARDFLKLSSLLSNRVSRAIKYISKSIE